MKLASNGLGAAYIMQSAANRRFFIKSDTKNFCACVGRDKKPFVVSAYGCPELRSSKLGSAPDARNRIRLQRIFYP